MEEEETVAVQVCCSSTVYEWPPRRLAANVVPSASPNNIFHRGWFMSYPTFSSPFFSRSGLLNTSNPSDSLIIRTSSDTGTHHCTSWYERSLYPRCVQKGQTLSVRSPLFTPPHCTTGPSLCSYCTLCSFLRAGVCASAPSYQQD